MAAIKESIDIAAPPERVWGVVAQDVRNAPKWTTNLDRVEKLDDGPPGKGTRYRYHLSLPGGRKIEVDVEQDVWNEARKCAGRFIKGPLKGTWTYTYTRKKDGTTRLTYDTEYELTGLLRFATGVFGPQYASGIRSNMERLKTYIESGKGPKEVRA